MPNCLSKPDLHLLAVSDLRARIRLAVWPIVQADPGRLVILAEAMLLAQTDIQREAARRGLATPTATDQAPNFATAGQTLTCGARSGGEAGLDTLEGAVACGEAVARLDAYRETLKG